MKTNKIQIISFVVALTLIITSVFTTVAFLSNDMGIVKGNTIEADEKDILSVGEIETNLNPCLEITKYAKNGEDGVYDDISVDAYPGDTIYFWIKIENAGNTLLDISIDDYLPAGLEYFISDDEVLEPNALVDGVPLEPTFRADGSFYWKFDNVQSSQIINITFKVTVVDTGELENLAVAAGLFRDTRITVDDTAIVNVRACEPDIEIEKKVWNGTDWTEFAEVNINDIVNFKVIIYNPSDCYLIHFSGTVFDQLPNNLRYINESTTIFPEGYPGHPDFPWPEGYHLEWEEYDWENNTVIWHRPPAIMPHENLTFYYNATAVDCGIGINNITAHPEGFTPVDYPGGEVSNQDGSYDVSDYSTVNVICPSNPNISVMKSVKILPCDDYDEEGLNASFSDSVRFKIEIANTGDIPLNVTVHDSLPLGFIYNDNAVPYEPNETLYPLNGHVIFVWNMGFVDPGETVVITFDAKIDECGELINLVSAQGYYADEDFVEDTDDAFVFVSCPGIDIVKDVDNPLIHSGDLVTYAYALINTGNSPLDILSVMDDQGLVPVYVSGDDDLDGLLDVDEIWVYSATANPTEDVTNIGNVTAEDEHGTCVYAEDDAFVDVIHPDIKVEKTVTPCCVNPGEEATWNITVENTGDVTLTNVYVEDDNMGILLGMFTLAPGEKLYYEYTTNPIEETTNTVVVNGTDPLDLEVSDSDSATVEICQVNMDFEVEKIVKWNCHGETYGDYIYSHVGDWVTFNITVNNTGDVAINLTVCDVLPDGLSYSGHPRVNGAEIHPVDGCWTINDVQPGEIVIITFRATVMDCGEHINTVTVTAIHDGYEPIVKQDDATVFAICPGIKVVKTADSNLVCMGEEVTYTYEINNTGNHYLKNISLTDDKISGVSYVSGDDDLDDELDCDEIWIYTATSALSENTTNIANVSGEDELGSIVEDNDTEFVEVIECQQPPNLGIEVNKTVKRNCCGDFGKVAVVHDNDWVTFNITVENTGEEILEVIVVDTLPAGLTYDDSCYVDGSSFMPDVDGQIITFDIGSVDSGETVIITFKATVDSQVCGSLINNVYVNGSYQDYPEVTDEDFAEVFVLCPEISIEKTANPTLINPGDLVTYTYTITNPGNCPLSNVVVTDDQGLTPNRVSGDDGDSILQTDETWIYQATANPTEDVTNIGTVTANDELGKQVDASDDAFVDVEECVCTPNVSINKEVYYDGEWNDSLDVQTEENSIEVMFRITVENTGTCDLENISIIDTYECGIEYLRDFTGDFTSYDIIGDKVFFTVNEPFTHDADPIVILFNATIYINTTNHVEVLANSTYDETGVCSYDFVTIKINDETENNPPYKPGDPNPEDGAEDISINPTLYIYVEDPDGDLLTVSFFNESGELLGTVYDVAAVADAELHLFGLEYDTEYSWYAVVNDGEYSNTSDIFTFRTMEDTGADPTVEILTPEVGSIYFRGTPINAAFLENALVIGGINITVNASDLDGTITNIDFMVDGEVINSTLNSYYYWNEKAFGWRTITVKVTDDTGNTAEDSIDVFMLNRGK